MACLIATSCASPRFSGITSSVQKMVDEGDMSGAVTVVTTKDQVLYLKHNLNARAIASLEGNVAGIERDVDALVREMQDAIAEADRFVAAVEG